MILIPHGPVFFSYDTFAISIVAMMLGFAYGPGLDQSGKPRISLARFSLKTLTLPPIVTLTVWQSAGLKVATLVGNLNGQLLFGWLADILGRKRMCE